MIEYDLLYQINTNSNNNEVQKIADYLTKRGIGGNIIKISKNYTIIKPKITGHKIKIVVTQPNGCNHKFEELKDNLTKILNNEHVGAKIL